MDILPMADRNELTDDEFFNRSAELDNLFNLLESTSNGNAPDIMLTGIRGVGKTVFLKKIKNNWIKIIWLFMLIFQELNVIEKEICLLLG